MMTRPTANGSNKPITVRLNVADCPKPIMDAMNAVIGQWVKKR
jgi:hypothetical protein